MYDIVNQISNALMQPFLNIIHLTEGIPILFAFILGIVGAMAPCQFSGNLGAITIFGNQSVQKHVAWGKVAFFILGKTTVFFVFGAIIWLLGNEVSSFFPLFFPWFRKIVGPVLIITGLFMLGLIKLNKALSLGILQNRFSKKGRIGAFLLGASFTLGFCPTMFVLFFLNLLPISFTVPYGITLPILFAIGTSLPLIFAIILIWYFDLSGRFVKKNGRKLGLVVQKTAGIIMILLGIFDILTFW